MSAAIGTFADAVVPYARTAAPAYHREFRSAPATVAVVAGTIGAWSLLAMVALSAAIGAAGLVIAFAAAVLDAKYATPARIDVDEHGVTLGFWKRDKRYAPRAIVVRHDVPRDRFTITRRSRGRAIARFKEAERGAIDAFVAAGIEVLSK